MRTIGWATINTYVLLVFAQIDEKQDQHKFSMLWWEHNLYDQKNHNWAMKLFPLLLIKYCKIILKVSNQFIIYKYNDLKTNLV